MDVANAVAHHELHHAHGDMVPFRVLRAIRTWLWTRWWFQCMSNYSLQGFKGIELLQTWQGHSYVVKCKSTWKSGQPPLWQTCRCSSAHGYSFMRVQYICVNGHHAYSAYVCVLGKEKMCVIHHPMHTCCESRMKKSAYLNNMQSNFVFFGQMRWLLFFFPVIFVQLLFEGSVCMFLWKAHRHQRWLDRVHTSNTMTTVRCCQ